MAKLKIDARLKKNLAPEVKREAKNAIRTAIRVIAQDLARTASETAPHLTGDLEDSYSISYAGSNGYKAQATVEFSIYKGDFNYAIAMHEWNYKLGAGSQAKAGGTGMSGTHYAVGRKYLERVLKGESEAYQEYVAKKLKEAIGE